MFQSRMIVGAALLAFGAVVASPAMAGASKNGGGCSGCGGGGGGGGYTRIICIVDGHRFEVTDEKSCAVRRQYHREYRIVRQYERHITFRHARKLRVCGCAYAQDGYEGGYQGGYSGYGYYTTGSTAARMQAERRARAYELTDGGVYFGQDEGSYDQPRRHYKKLRRFHGYGNDDMGGYEAGYIYNPGYVIHYGPTISKDGGN